MCYKGLNKIVCSVAESKSKHTLSTLVASIDLYFLVLSKIKWDFNNVTQACSKINICIEGIHGTEPQKSQLLNELQVNIFKTIFQFIAHRIGINFFL